jgi:hypothetical protein
MHQSVDKLSWCGCTHLSCPRSNAPCCWICQGSLDSTDCYIRSSDYWTTESLTLSLGLCQRRHWPDPLFQTYRTRHGYGATVRVNNREYSTDVDYESEELAKNAAATRAYMICRNFSVNDGRDPGQRPGQVPQGLPVAIGTGRRNTCSSNDYDSSSSGGTSPRNSDYGLDTVDAVGRRSSKSSASSASNCYCGRGLIRVYERCNHCLHEAGYRV